MKIIDEVLLLAFRLRGRCDWCGKAGAVDPAHVFARGMGGGHRLDIEINLCSLCRTCHEDHHRGERPTRTDLIAVVAAREKMLQEDVIAEIHRLQMAPRRGIQ